MSNTSRLFEELKKSGTISNEVLEITQMESLRPEEELELFPGEVCDTEIGKLIIKSVELAEGFIVVDLSGFVTTISVTEFKLSNPVLREE